MAVVEVLQHGREALGGDLVHLDGVLLLLPHVVAEHGREVVAGLGQHVAVGPERLAAHLELHVTVVVVHLGLHLAEARVDVLVFVARDLRPEKNMCPRGSN